MQRYVIQDGKGKLIDVQESGARAGFTMKDGKGQLVDFPAWDPSQDPALIRANEAYNLAETADGKADDAQADASELQETVYGPAQTLQGSVSLPLEGATLMADLGFANYEQVFVYRYPGITPGVPYDELFSTYVDVGDTFDTFAARFNLASANAGGLVELSWNYNFDFDLYGARFTALSGPLGFRIAESFGDPTSGAPKLGFSNALVQSSGGVVTKLDEIRQDVEITPFTPAINAAVLGVFVNPGDLLSSFGLTSGDLPLNVFVFPPNGDIFAPPTLTVNVGWPDLTGITIQDMLDAFNAEMDFAVMEIVGGYLRVRQTNDVPMTLIVGSQGIPFIGLDKLGWQAGASQISDPAVTSAPGRTVLMDATHVAYGDISVQEALDALSQPDPESSIVIYEMLHNSREPYTRFPLLPAGVAEVAPGDIVVNAMPVIKSSSFPDVSIPSAAGLTFTFTDDVGRKDDNSTINYTFTTTGATVSLLERIEQLNAALAAEGIALVVIAQEGSFDVLAAYGKWSGVADVGGEGRAKISGTLADELGLTGDLLPTRTGYMDMLTFNQVRFNGGYRSWSKLSLFSDGGGLYSDGRLWLPDVTTQWITFGVAVARPGGAPGELDIITRNATIVGSAVTPNPLLTFGDPMREYIEPRGLVYK